MNCQEFIDASKHNWHCTQKGAAPPPQIVQNAYAKNRSMKDHRAVFEVEFLLCLIVQNHIDKLFYLSFSRRLLLCES